MGGIILMTGRLTLPTDADVIDETLRLKNLLGADALRDCDGTEMPEELLSEPVKKYATYYTTRKDNEWASANPEEIQQEYLISNRVTARGETLRIRLMEGFHTEQLKVNTLDDPKRWWEVIDRTTGEIVPTDKWEFDEATGEAYQISSPGWAGAYPWINKQDRVYGFFIAHVQGSSQKEDGFSSFFGSPVISQTVSNIISLKR